MLFMYGMDFKQVGHQHKLIEALLDEKNAKSIETTVIKENINIEEDNIIF